MECIAPASKAHTAAERPGSGLFVTGQRALAAHRLPGPQFLYIARFRGKPLVSRREFG
jgi:hypothetical protein